MQATTSLEKQLDLKAPKSAQATQVAKQYVEDRKFKAQRQVKAAHTAAKVTLNSWMKREYVIL